VISLEQVQLLEAKVAKAIEFVQNVTAENNKLSCERAGLQIKLDSYQKRIDELEVLIMRFKEDQSRIEDGIIAALDRLSQFEEAFESSLKDEKTAEKKPAVKREKTPETEPPKKTQAESALRKESKEFFEIKEAADRLLSDSFPTADEELDIF